MKLSKIIQNGIIFQREKPVFVSGEAKGEVTVSFLGEEKTVIADGKFLIELSPRAAGGPYEMTVSGDGEKINVNNIMIGEVFIVAGQSNAELTIAETDDCDTVFQSDGNIRIYADSYADVDESFNPVQRDTDFTGKWISLTEENAKKWTAIGLHTAEFFRKKCGVAVGIMCCYKGAAVIESFLSEEILSKYAIDKSKLMGDHFAPSCAWNNFSYIYNNLLLPLVPMQCKAIIWYQGESNRTFYEAENFYTDWLCDLVSMWRKLLFDARLPFEVIEINDYPEKCEESVHAVQRAQERATEKLENCDFIKIADMGWHGFIHPKNKREVSERICASLTKYF